MVFIYYANFCRHCEGDATLFHSYNYCRKYRKYF
jgi:hypothetical protein